MTTFQRIILCPLKRSQMFLTLLFNRKSSLNEFIPKRSVSPSSVADDFVNMIFFYPLPAGYLEVIQFQDFLQSTNKDSLLWQKKKKKRRREVKPVKFHHGSSLEDFQNPILDQSPPPHFLSDSLLGLPEVEVLHF